MSKTVCQNTLPFHSHRNITARFDGGSLTSDAGWLLFGSLDRQHRLCEGFSSCIAESRDRRYVRHDLLKLIRQRVLQIVKLKDGVPFDLKRWGETVSLRENARDDLVKEEKVK